MVQKQEKKERRIRSDLSSCLFVCLFSKIPVHEDEGVLSFPFARVKNFEHRSIPNLSGISACPSRVRVNLSFLMGITSHEKKGQFSLVSSLCPFHSQFPSFLPSSSSLSPESLEWKSQQGKREGLSLSSLSLQSLSFPSSFHPFPFSFFHFSRRVT